MTDTSAANPATLALVPKGMVLQNTFDSAVSTPTDKRGLLTPSFLGVVRLHCPRMVLGGMAEAVTPGAWLNPCFEHPARPTCFKTRMAVYLIHSGIQTMTATTQGRIAPTLPTQGTHHHAHQLFADACNHASMAAWHSKRGNIAAAQRRARLHLAALRALVKDMQEV